MFEQSTENFLEALEKKVPAQNMSFTRISQPGFEATAFELVHVQLFVIRVMPNYMLMY